MKRIKIESSSIKSIGYDWEWSRLEVEFTRGAVYRYEKVYPETVCHLLFADSIGRYFSKHIAINYKYERIDK